MIKSYLIIIRHQNLNWYYGRKYYSHCDWNPYYTNNIHQAYQFPDTIGGHADIERLIWEKLIPDEDHSVSPEPSYSYTIEKHIISAL